MRGTIGEYHWAEFWHEQPELTVPGVIRALAPRVCGLVACNTSWDSGVLAPGSVPFAGWNKVGRHAVSPVITELLASQWPRSSCGWDEWYFFRPPAPNVDLKPFCNWQHLSIGEWEKLGFPDGFNLREQLEHARPEVVIGEGDKVFLLALDPKTVEEFSALAREV